MIFASDLDRTLIYSNIFLDETLPKVLPIEVYEQRIISYITPTILDYLIRVDKGCHLVPVTTRNLEQYQRIEIFQELISPELFVVNNGGTIFYRGKEDLGWSRHIQQKIGEMGLTYEKAIQLFLELYKGPIKNYRKSDGLIWVVIGEKEHIDWQGIQQYKKLIEGTDWQIDINGKKIYVYPKFINKWEAVRYIQDHYYQESVSAAGDSLFDYEMVHKAEHGFVPKGAYIEEQCESKIYITKQEGMLAAEEILENLLSLIDYERKQQEA